MQVRHLIEDFWKTTHLQRGYQLLYTPHIAKVDLWKTSGHFDFYRESMFNQIDVDTEEYQACVGQSWLGCEKAQAPQVPVLFVAC